MSKTTLKRPRPAADDPISSGRRTQHISRACAGCRGRKYRCDDQVPACGQCTTRKIECIRSVRIDKRRALTKAEVEELNDNIQQLENVQRCLKNDNELLKYQISWLLEELRKHGVANVDIPTKLPSSPALLHLSPDSSPSLSPYLPFLLSPASPSGSLPVDSPVDNKGLMLHSDPQLFSADYLPYALSGSLPDNGMHLSPMYTSGRPSTMSLSHPIPAFNAGFSTAINDYAGIHARAIPHSAPPMLRIPTASNDGISDITTIFSNAVLASPARSRFALNSLLPPSVSSARNGPATTHPAFYSRCYSPATSFDALNVTSPSSSSFVGTPSSTTTVAFPPATLGHTALLASPLLSPFGSSMPSAFEPPSYTRTNDTAGGDEGILFRAERIESRDDTLMKM